MKLTPPEHEHQSDSKAPSEHLPVAKKGVFEMPEINPNFYKNTDLLLRFFMGLFAYAVLTGALVVLVCTSLSKHRTVFDLASHFVPQAAVVLIFSLTVFIWLRKWLFTGIAVTGLIIALTLIYPFYERQMPWVEQPQVSEYTKTYKLMQLNVLKSNHEFEKVLAFIRQENPDMIVLQETGLDWANQLWTVEKYYPYNYVIPREDGFGLAIYSRLPFNSVETRFFGESRKYDYLPFPSIQVNVQTDDGAFTLINTHPIPPVGGFTFRNSQLRDIASHAKATQSPLIISGDMNVTPWSYHYRQFVQDSALLDSQKISGLQPSWPVTKYVKNQKGWLSMVLPVVRIPIDHVFVNEGIQIKKRTLGKSIGSDHLPVLVEFSLQYSQPNIQIPEKQIIEENDEINESEPE